MLADEMFATRRNGPMGPTLREPLTDVLHVDASKVSSLFGRQHVAANLTRGTMRRHRPSNDPFVLEKRNLNSSSFCCRHSQVVESLSPLSRSFWSAEKLLDSSRQVWNKTGNKSEIIQKP